MYYILFTAIVVVVILLALGWLWWIDRDRYCPTCKGAGYLQDVGYGEEIECPNCQGTGRRL